MTRIVQESPLELIIEARNSESLQRALKTLAGRIQPPLLVRLTGNLGSGKTTLVSALLRFWQAEGATSPTFNLRNDYLLSNFRVIHLDFYRLKPTDDAMDLLPPDEDYSDAVVFVEWPDKGPQHLYAPFSRQAELLLDVRGDESRRIIWRLL